jgi:hypothetical protein
MAFVQTGNQVTDFKAFLRRAHTDRAAIMQ